MDLISPTRPSAPTTHRPAPSSGLHEERNERDRLTRLARHAWRLADRCVSRSGWRSLAVRDRTHLTEAHEIELPDGRLYLASLDRGVILEVLIRHPTGPYFDDMGLRWSGSPGGNGASRDDTWREAPCLT
jgi:nitric oxide synthase oxygenase domain/subunit